MTARMVDDTNGAQRAQLDSGLRVVTEHLPGLRSAAVGFWVGTGSRDEPERQVILEEIRMRDDTPDDLVHDVFAGALFARHPLGREVAGSQETIGAITRDEIAAYHADHYQPSNVVVAVAGNVDHDEVVA